jgi:hypothetical protein
VAEPRISPFLRLPFIDDAEKAHWFSLSVAQQIFTPQDILSYDVVEDDRPYAGWLYGSAKWSQSDRKIADIIDLQVGVVGPAAHGKEVMYYFHDRFGNSRPNGWDNQLNNEPGIVLAYKHKKRYPFEFKGSNGSRLDIIPAAGFALGNVHTYINLGTHFRYGWNMPASLGAELISPAGENRLPAGYIAKRVKDPSRISFYFFGALEARYVYRNIFLDGNTFTDSHRVDKIPFVLDLGLGMVFRYDRFLFSYYHNIRSKEFIYQLDAHQFASLTVSWEFN